MNIKRADFHVVAAQPESASGDHRPVRECRPVVAPHLPAALVVIGAAVQYLIEDSRRAHALVLAVPEARGVERGPCAAVEREDSGHAALLHVPRTQDEVPVINYHRARNYQVRAAQSPAVFYEVEAGAVISPYL